MTVAGRRGTLIAALIALGATALGPALALAGSPRSGGMAGTRLPGVRGSAPFFFTGKPFTPPNIPKHFGTPHGKPHFFPKPFFGRGFVGPFCCGGGAVIYSAPYWGAPAYASSPVYYDPPAYVYSAPAATTVAVVPPAPAPPMQNVVEYPHGRYELRGDGMNTAYTWVWVPAPPSAPPPPANGGGQPSSAPPREVYRWTDADGVLHMTDRLASVPERYRAAAKQSAQP
jgi:hypothetical protein